MCETDYAWPKLNWPEHPAVATLRADLATAEARLAAVTALADTADARPGTCHERGLVSTRLIRAAVAGPTEGSK